MSNLNNVTTSDAPAFVPSVFFGGKRIINLNKHEIVLRLPGGGDVVFPPSGVVCALAVKQVPQDEIGGIPIMGNVYGEIEGVPSPKKDVLYIVNAMVLSRLKRKDCIAPDTGPSAIREAGQVKAVIRFIGA